MDEDTRSISWTVSEKESIITRIAQQEAKILQLEQSVQELTETIALILQRF
jgi:methyl-accepting chemotaxis protein